MASSTHIASNACYLVKPVQLLHTGVVWMVRWRALEQSIVCPEHVSVLVCLSRCAPWGPPVASY